MIDNSPDRQRPFTLAEVVELFNVHEDTAKRWAAQGRMGAFRTPSDDARGHWRFPAHKVREQMGERSGDQADTKAGAPPAAAAAVRASYQGEPADSYCPAWRDGTCECASHCLN